MTAAASAAHGEEGWRSLVEALWNIIDNIDTVDDMAKGDDHAYRTQVRRQQAKRWETGITTDGYGLAMPWEPALEPEPARNLKELDA